MIEAIPHLAEAMTGRPTEGKAVGLIALYTVIPLAGVGVVAGGFFAPGADDGSMIVGAVVGGSAAAVVGLATVYGVYRLLGFRAVAWLAGFYIGAIVGVLVGILLAVMFNALWGLLCAPAFGLLNATFRLYPRKPKHDTPPDPPQLGEWRPKWK